MTTSIPPSVLVQAGSKALSHFTRPHSMPPSSAALEAAGRRAMEILAPHIEAAALGTARDAFTANDEPSRRVRHHLSTLEQRARARAERTSGKVS